jgi:hypothetical protein
MRHRCVICSVFGWPPAVYSWDEGAHLVLPIGRLHSLGLICVTRFLVHAVVRAGVAVRGEWLEMTENALLTNSRGTSYLPGPGVDGSVWQGGI